MYVAHIATPPPLRAHNMSRHRQTSPFPRAPRRRMPAHRCLPTMRAFYEFSPRAASRHHDFFAVTTSRASVTPMLDACGVSLMTTSGVDFPAPFSCALAHAACRRPPAYTNALMDLMAENFAQHDGWPARRIHGPPSITSATGRH